MVCSMSEWLTMPASRRLHLTLLLWLCVSGCICLCVCIRACTLQHWEFNVPVCRSAYREQLRLQAALAARGAHSVSITLSSAGYPSLMRLFHFKQVILYFWKVQWWISWGGAFSLCRSHSFIYIPHKGGLLPWRTTYTHIASCLLNVKSVCAFSVEWGRENPSPPPCESDM